MWKKTTLAILTAALTAGSAVQPIAAQGYNQYPPYPDQYSSPPPPPYDAPPPPPPYDAPPPPPSYDASPPPPPPPPYDSYNAPPPDRYAEDYDYAAEDAYYRECVQQRQNNQVGGLVIGAIAGGILGNAITRGPARGPGTALGAILGGAAGATVGGSLNCEDRAYAYRAYYSGLESGRAHARYDWRSPRGDAYGYFEVGEYYESGGQRCATYTQRIYVHGRPEVARGFACKQPDGYWVFRT